MPSRLFLAAFALLAFGGCATPLAHAPVQATYVNPVLDADFPDPTVIRAPDGAYYGYATQTERGGIENFTASGESSKSSTSPA